MNKKIYYILVVTILLTISICIIIKLGNIDKNKTEDKQIKIEENILIANKEDFEKVHKEIYINENETYIMNFQKIEERANEILNEELCVYEIDEGNRLLFVSRQCKDVIENLSFMIKILEIHKQYVSNTEIAELQEKIDKYTKRAVEELINVCNFQDWHPEHFLDTAEMSYSVALGYNWLYEYLSENERKIIENAILEKALMPSLSNKYYRQFAEKENNWNQVCNGAMIVSAIAIYNAKDIDVELCEKIINRGIEELPKALEQIKPDGGYVEGITYWEYGNSYMIYALSTMNLTLNNTYGLLDNDFMKQTELYPIYLTGKSSNDLQETKVFNYGDADNFIVNIAASTWLANKYYKDKELSYIVNWYQENYQKNLNIYQLLWQEEEYVIDKISREDLENILKNISDKKYTNSEVAVLQNNILDKDGIYVAIKAGKNGSNNHFDLDIGSFVLDAMGTRWIEDFGKENYNVDGYWGKTSRWNYYKKRAESHSTIIIENEDNRVMPDQYIEADCKIIDFQSDDTQSFAVLDLSNAYNANDNTEDYEINSRNKNNNKIERKITLDKQNNKIILEDEIALEKESNLCSMFNVSKGTEISIDSSGTIATLKQKVKQEDGTEEEKTLIAQIINDNAKWQIMNKIPENKDLLDFGDNPDLKVNLENEEEEKLCISLKNFQSGKIVIEFLPQ